MKSYSQNAEDLFILDYFKGYKGTLLEIGANDGQTLSNSLLLIENGWKAHLVEPGMVCDRLKLLHIANHNVNCHYFAIGEQNGTMALAESGEHVPGGTDRGLVSSLVPYETERWRNAGVAFMETEVKVYDFKTFLKGIAPISFDFISIDAEGMDWQILQQINLRLTSCLCIEWNGIAELQVQFNNYCGLYGLKLAHVNSENLIFVK